MIYVEALNEITGRAPRPIVFIAGNITGSDDWQSKVVEALSDLNCTVVNPRRKNFPADDKDAAKIQIEWEARNLWEHTDIFSMYMTSDTLAPICLLEIGMMLGRMGSVFKMGMNTAVSNIPFSGVVMGCDADYARKFDVEQQASYVFNEDVTLHSTVEEHIKFLRIGIEAFIDFLHEGLVPEDLDDDPPRPFARKNADGTVIVFEKDDVNEEDVEPDIEL